MYRLKDGRTLRQACITYDLPYNRVYARMLRKDLTPDEVVEASLKGPGVWDIVLYRLSDGTSLTDFCKSNKLCYASVRNRMQRWKLSVDDAVKACMNKGSRTHYMHKLKNGKALVDHCKETGDNYFSVIAIKNNKMCSVDEALDIYHKNGRRKIMEPKYLYKGKSILNWCRELGLTKTDYYKILEGVKVKKNVKSLLMDRIIYRKEKERKKNV